MPGKAIGPALLVAAVSFGCLVIFRTNIQPWQEFNPRTAEYLFVRDATSGELPTVPTDLFSTVNVDRYHKGDGFMATFKVANDPRKDFETTEERCGVESWGGSYGEMDNPFRRRRVAQRQTEFKKCLSHFMVTFSIRQSVEIGLDDTEGVDGGMRDFVTFNLERSLGSPEGLLTSGEATRLSTRLVFFRISRDLVPRRRFWEIEPGIGKEATKEIFENGLKWLLAPASRKEETALADNLLNVFKDNQDVALRRIVIFSDGMENSPATTSFYRVFREPQFLDPPNYEALDKSISSLEGFPDLRSARITWYIPSYPGRHFRAVARYWEHVLKDLGNNPRAEVIN